MGEDGSDVNWLEYEESLERIDRLISQGDLEGAHALLKEVSGGFTEGTGPGIVVKYLVKEGHIAVLRSQWPEAEQYFKNAEKMIIPHLKEDEYGWEKLAQTLFTEYGMMYWRLADYDKGETYLAKAASISRSMDAAKGRVYLELGNVYGERGEIKKAIDSYNMAIHILRELEELDDLVRAYNNIADAYIKKRDYDWAVFFSERCVELCKNLKNKRALAIASVTAAEALAKNQDTKLARSYLDLATRSVEGLDDKYVQGCILCLQGIVETQDGAYEVARIAFQGAERIMAETKIPFYLGRIFFEYGVMHLKMGEKQTAREYFERARSVFEEHKCHAELDATIEQLAQMDAPGI